MKKILFVCTGNTCRSPMAEGLMAKLIDDKGIEDVITESAGISAFFNDPPTENAILALKEKGIDISDHRSQRINMQLIAESSLIVALSQSHYDILKDYAEKKLVLLGDGIPDPFGGDLDIYRECRDSIEAALPKIEDMVDSLEDMPEFEDMDMDGIAEDGSSKC